jgi:hypothetical protein
MGFLKYSEEEVRRLVSRTIPIRWPTEQLLFITRCRVERPGIRLGGDLAIGPDEDTVAPDDGFLVATQNRLIFQARVTHALVIRGMAVALATFAAGALLFGNSLAGFFGLALAALAFWFGARVAELLTTGRRDVEYGRIFHVDRLGQGIEGATKAGDLYRLRVPDPSDFLMLAALVTGHPQTGAA